MQTNWALEKVVFGELLHLTEGLTKLGRNPTCTIRIASDFVSRNHAEIQVEADGNVVQIRDLGSTNGVFVNDVHYSSEVCQLTEGDRIGIGVYVDDHTVSEHPDGKFPMYFLRRLRKEPQQTKDDIHKSEANDQPPPNEIQQSIPPMVEAVAAAARPEPSEIDSEDEDIVMDETDSEYDDINEKEKFIVPKQRIDSNERMCFVDEPVPAASTSNNIDKSVISANIQSIFGDLNPVLNNLSKDAREIAESTASLVKPLESENVICISSDDECETDKRQKIAKSPELFDDSFNSDGGNANAEKGKQACQIVNDSKILPPPVKDPPVSIPLEMNPQCIELPKVASTSKENDATEVVTKKEFELEEDDDLFFTQKIFEDMKDELQDFENENLKLEEDIPFAVNLIKKEVVPNDLNGTIICLEDDDEFDEEFESKVNDWSLKLSSQSFSSFNKSQVYEDGTDDEFVPTRETVFTSSDDEDMGIDKQDRVLEHVVNDEGVKQLEKKKEPVKVQQNLIKQLFSSTSSSDSSEEENHNKPTTSSSNKHKKLTRKSSTTEQVQKKKRRIDLESNECTSATIARRLSVGSHFFDDENEAMCFEQIEKPRDVETTTPSKVLEDPKNSKPEESPMRVKAIRGPPEIIQPPNLPVNKGKLRGSFRLNRKKPIGQCQSCNLFGGVNPVLSNLSKDAREKVESTANHNKYENDKGQNIAKIPELFDDSFNSNGDSNVNAEMEKQAYQIVNDGKKLCPSVLHPSGSNPLKKNLQAIEPPKVASMSKENDPTVVVVKKEFELEEDDDLFFTQKIFEDMKDELQDLDNEILKLEEDIPFAVNLIKKEVVPNDLNGTTICLEDDDEFDEEFESKVNDWSLKLSSQSFSSFNKSPVYEDEIDDEFLTTITKETIFTSSDDEDMGIDKQDPILEPVVNDEGVNQLKKKNEPLKAMQSLIKELFSSTSSSSDSSEEDNHSKLTSLLSMKNKKLIRESSTTEKVQKKKLRIDLKSNGSTGSIYKTTTITTRILIKSHIFDEQNEATYFEDIKKPQDVKTKPPNKALKEPMKSKLEESAIRVKAIRNLPEVIQSQNFPVNKINLRGISAQKTRIMEILKASSCQSDLKRKWLEKPSIADKKEKEKNKAIKEDRKQKLKELADKNKLENIENNNKRPNKNVELDKETSKKNLKVKVTSVNRGAFLTEEAPTSKKTNFKIPKKNSKLNESPKNAEERPKASSSKASLPVTNTKDCTNSLKTSTQVATGFCMELAKADFPLQNNRSLARQKSTDSSTEQKQRAPPRRNSKKLTFDSVNQLYDENERLKERANQLVAETKRTKKKVRFNDVPQIFYIESNKWANRKVHQAESPVFALRKNAIRREYPIVDFTNSMINEVLMWSQHWLENRQVAVNLSVFPMASRFQSFSNYKSIVFPLLKLEHLGHLEKNMELNASRPGCIAEVDYHTQDRGRDILFAKCNTPIKQSDLGTHDLALLDISVDNVKSQHFGFISNVRRSDTCNVITIEINRNAINRNYLKTKPKIRIRRIIDGVLIHLSTFNAVHQLEKTPLIKKILNPLELLTVRNNCTSSEIEYKGIDSLNTEQLDILLKTYERAIDQTNPNISLINGPPGTGKSILIANLAIQLLYGDEVHQLDKKILICAQSNMAVDVIAEKLIKIKASLQPEIPKFNVIRFGNDERIHPNVKEITLNTLLQRHRASAFRTNNPCRDQIANAENLKMEILQLEARIADLENTTLKDVRQDELIEMRKNLTLKKNIVNQSQSLRPEDERKLKMWLLDKANIVCVTLSSCVKLSNIVDYFDICIIDEATQCTEPWTLMPLKFGISNLIMVGDTQQLPATVISVKAKDLGLGTSLFTRIQRCLESTYRDKPSPVLTPQRFKEEFKPIFTLCEQYRMHSEISKWPNMYFYKNQLKNCPKTDDFKCSIRPFSILNLEYLQNDSNNGQISNSLEADFVTKLVMVLDDYIPNKFFSYGVITPYAHHRQKLEAMIRNRGLTDVMVNTIDSYQGLEKDVIIISNARTRGVGFLANYQRLNVALTRPKKCLILCGNFKNLESVPSWASLLANARERRLYHDISTKDALDITKNVIEKIKIKR